VIEADFLQPTHNKQDFDYTPAYRRCIAKLSDLLEVYWYDIKKSPALSQSKKVQSVANNSTPSSYSSTSTSSSSVVAISKPSQSQIILLPYTDSPIPSDPNAKPDVIPYGDDVEVVESTQNSPDEIWVQCDNCLKWRKLPASTRAEALPDKWYCYMNTYDPARSDCAVVQQADDEPDDNVSLKGARKKQKEMAQANKKAEEAKKAAVLQQEELAKKQQEDKRLREMEAETNRLKAEQEKQRKVIEDQQKRELQYQEQVRAMMEKEQQRKQQESMMKVESDKKRKELESWLQDEEINIKKRKGADDEVSAKPAHTNPKIETHPAAYSSSSTLTPVHVPPTPAPPHPTSTSPTSPTSTAIPPKPLSTAIKRLSHPAPTTNGTTTHISPPKQASTPSHVTPSVPHITPPAYVPSPAPLTPNLELHNKAFANMALLVNSLNLPGVNVTSDAASLANLDVSRLIEQAHTQYSAKPRTELSNLRHWVKKLLVLLARTKDINVEDAELDSYFVEWVKRQEAKRKAD